MKRTMLSLLLAIIATTVFAQSGPIAVTIISSEPVTGVTTINYSFSGISGRYYDIVVEVKFDDADYVPIPVADLSGDISNVIGTGTDFSGTIVWNGNASFPNLYHEQTRIRITATPNFDCGNQITDIDGNVYNTVSIGTQCWMKENLNTTRDAAGNDISRLCYNENITYCELYGGLYSWTTLMNGANSSNSNPSGVQGICPMGWHVPSDAEWTQLIDYIVLQGYPNDNVLIGTGNALKSCRQVNSPLGGDCNTTEHPRWSSNEIQYGFDEFGFSAFPGGYRYPHAFTSIGDFGIWWSSTQYSSESARHRSMNTSNGFVNRGYSYKYHRHSVRCIKD